MLPDPLPSRQVRGVLLHGDGASSIFSSKDEPGERVRFPYKMSLEAVAKRPAAGPPFGFEFEITKAVLWESGKPAFGFPLFHSLVAAVGMWESRLRFPRAVARHFHRRLWFMRSASV